VKNAKLAILQFIQSREITTRSDIVRNFDLPQRTITHYLKQLTIELKIFRSICKGYFSDELACRKWLEANPVSRKRRTYKRVRVSPVTENVIFTECRNSPAMQRVLFVYGASD
jgi:hypothetical protein